MRKFLIAFAVCTSLAFSMAEPGGIPPEIRNIKVIVVDKKGVKHEFRNPTCEGLSYLKVRKGELEYSISITKIKKIEILETGEDYVKIKITTVDNKKDIFEASPGTFCIGQSDLGNVTFTLKDVKEIILERR